MSATKPVTPTPAQPLAYLPTGDQRIIDALDRLETIRLFITVNGIDQPTLARLAERTADLTEQLLAHAHRWGCMERTALSLRLSE